MYFISVISLQIFSSLANRYLLCLLFLVLETRSRFLQVKIDPCTSLLFLTSSLTNSKHLQGLNGKAFLTLDSLQYLDSLLEKTDWVDSWLLGEFCFYCSQAFNCFLRNYESHFFSRSIQFEFFPCIFPFHSVQIRFEEFFSLRISSFSPNILIFGPVHFASFLFFIPMWRGHYYKDRNNK